MISIAFLPLTTDQLNSVRSRVASQVVDDQVHLFNGPAPAVAERRYIYLVTRFMPKLRERLSLVVAASYLSQSSQTLL
jgi:hypothetical protein